MTEQNSLTPEELAAQAAADAEKAKADAEAKAKAGAAGADDEVVKLQPAAYNALLDRLDELEEIARAKVQTPPANVDDLAAAAKGNRQPITEDDLSKMGPAALVNTILKHVHETQVQPLILKIEEMAVKQEIKELTRDGKNKDFFELKDDIYAIASKAPQLSLEEALILARENKKSKTPPASSDDTTNVKDLLRNLPPRRNIPGGERPGAARASISEGIAETRIDAAKMALADMKRAGKI